MGPLTLTRAAQTTSSAGRKQRATGERWVRVLSLIAFTISTWMLLTLAIQGLRVHGHVRLTTAYSHPA